VRPTKGAAPVRPGPSPSIQADVDATNARIKALREEAAKAAPTAEQLRLLRDEMRGVVKTLADLKSGT